MTRQILWKESREQGAVLLALVGLGAGLMAATAIVNGSTGAAEGLTFRTINVAGRVMLVMLVMTAGIVSGASLFAGEREGGTFTYLDHLPGSRWRVWWRKVFAGVLLTAVASGLLLVAAGVADQLGGDTPPVLIGWALAVAVLAAVGFGWGVFGSAKAESSLAACGLGLAGAGATVVLGGVVLAVLWNVVRHWLGLHDNGMIGLLVVWAVLFVPLPLAALVYTAPDRDRRLAEQDIRPEAREFSVRSLIPRVPRPGGGPRSRRMAWLMWRQLRVPLAVQGGIAVALGLFVVPWTDTWLSSLFWPGVGLVLGVFAGVATLADEQRSGAARFWAERRLPIGRLWRAKAVNGLALTLLLCVVALLPPLVAAIIGPRHTNGVLGALFQSGLFEPGFPNLTYLFLGPVYGFAFGHLAGLLFQKGIVAGAVGLLVGGTVGAAWGPSLVAGGVHGWMVFVPPLVALLTARWLAWPWATDQLGRRGPLLRLAGGTLAALLCVAAGLGYRAVGEVDVVADADAHLRFRAELPTFDEKQPGRDIRRALGKWQELPAELREDRSDLRVDGRPWADNEPPSAMGRQYAWQMYLVLQSGWPADRPDLDRWMDAAFADKWDQPIFEVVGKPVGVLEDPNEYPFLDQPMRYLPAFQQLGPVFLARGLQLQARGDPEAFLPRLEAWLAAVRTAKHHTLPLAETIATGTERAAYQALDRWLERLAGRPDLVQRALDLVRRHDTLDVPDPTGSMMAEQVMLQNAVDAPTQWLPRLLEGGVVRGGVPLGSRVSVRSETEANVVAFSWAVPWEKERLRRAVALGNDPARRPERADLLRGAPGLWYDELAMRQNWRREPTLLRTLAARRAAVLTLALRLNKLATGEYPATLGELVPARLAAVPADPFDGRPFRYRRVAAPETVLLPARLAQADGPKLPPGAHLNYPSYLELAGLAGGLTGWPFEPGWRTDDPAADAEAVGRAVGMPGGAAVGDPLPLAAEWQDAMRADDRLAAVRLTVGRAVLWSVGPDKLDDGGRLMDDAENRGGDLITLVPNPPVASPGTPAPGR